MTAPPARPSHHRGRPPARATSCASPTGRRVELAPDAVDRIRASRAVVDALVDGPTLIYGLNTGLGHMRDVQVPRETLRQYQELIVAATRARSATRCRPTVVRAAIAVRLNGIARGGSGASLPVAEGLAALLNRRRPPDRRDDGLGGRVGPDAHGRDRPGPDRPGRAESAARSCRAPRPSRAPASSPSSSSPRTASPDLGQRRLDRAGGARCRARAAASRASPTSRSRRRSRSTSGNPSVLDAAVLAAKPVPGQAAAGADIRAFLAGSGLFTPGVPASVQDPLSFRVGPQVHGAFREFIDILDDAR